LLLALSATPAWAATIKVGGTCTLARAIIAANTNTTAGGRCARGRGADSIVLPKKKTLRLRSPNNATYGPTGLPTIRSAITIIGNGSKIQRAPNAPAFRILSVASTGNLKLLNTTVSGGRADRGGGGAVYVDGGTLTLTNTTISGNSGGGIDAYDSVVNVINSTVSRNIGTGVSGIFNNVRITKSVISGNTRGGVFGYNGDLRITSSTISGNSGDGINQGGGRVLLTKTTISGNTRGIAVGNAEEYSTNVVLTQSTVTRNGRGGIRAYASEYGTNITFNRSIISGNGRFEAFADKPRPDHFISVTAGNFNIFGHSGKAGVKGFKPGPTDIVPKEPLHRILEPTLTNNASPTPTHALVPGSPAIDAVSDGTCPPPAIDQGETPVVLDGNGDGGPACDVGAVEQAPLPPGALPPPPPPSLAPVAPDPSAPPVPPAPPPPGESPPPDAPPPPPDGEQPPPVEEPPPTPDDGQLPPIEEPPPPALDGEQPPPDNGSPSGEPPQESLAPESPPASEEPPPAAPEQEVQPTKWGVAPF
jgi:hypothetical protein